MVKDLGPTMKSSQRAFTLIELLVVIAIIAILAAILFPVFAQAKAAAKAVACLSDTKQIGTALKIYSGDNDDRIIQPWTYGLWATFPTVYPADPVRAQNQYKWMDALFPYVKSTDIFVCPTQEFGNNGIYIRRDKLTGPTEQRWGTYSINATYWGTDYGALPNSNTDNSTSDTAIDDIAGTILVSDGSYNSFQTAWRDMSEQPTKVVGTGNSQYVRIKDYIYTDGCCQYEGATWFRHAGRSNVAFTDGHSKSIAPGQTLQKSTTGQDGGGAEDVHPRHGLILRVRLSGGGLFPSGKGRLRAYRVRSIAHRWTARCSGRSTSSRTPTGPGCGRRSIVWTDSPCARISVDGGVARRVAPGQAKTGEEEAREGDDESGFDLHGSWGRGSRDSGKGRERATLPRGSGRPGCGGSCGSFYPASPPGGWCCTTP